MKRTSHHRRGNVANPIGLAIRTAGKLSDQERAQILQPIQVAFGRMREGAATAADWMALASACNVAMAIELQGIVKGLREHLHTTELTLQTINRRAQDDVGRFPYALHLEEIEQLRHFVGLHGFQLGELSRGEYNRACDNAVNEVRSTGGQVLQQVPTMRQEALAL